MGISGADLPYCWQEWNDSCPQDIITNTVLSFIAWFLAHFCEHFTAVDWWRGVCAYGLTCYYFVTLFVCLFCRQLNPFLPVPLRQTPWYWYTICSNNMFLQFNQRGQGQAVGWWHGPKLINFFTWHFVFKQLVSFQTSQQVPPVMANPAVTKAAGVD